MTRRRLFLALSLLLAGLALAVLWPVGTLRQRAARKLEPRLDPASPTGLLAAAEGATLAAFAEVLVEDRALGEEQRRLVLEHVAEQAGTVPGYLSLYRSTAAFLDRLTGHPFGTLALDTRRALVGTRILPPSGSRPRELDLLFRRRELAIREIVVPDLINGYYRSPAGWLVVGYGMSPGHCGDLIRYTVPEPPSERA